MGDERRVGPARPGEFLPEQLDVPVAAPVNAAPVNAAGSAARVVPLPEAEAILGESLLKQFNDFQEEASPQTLRDALIGCHLSWLDMYKNTEEGAQKVPKIIARLIAGKTPEDIQNTYVNNPKRLKQDVNKALRKLMYEREEVNEGAGAAVGGEPAAAGQPILVRLFSANRPPITAETLR